MMKINFNDRPCPDAALYLSKFNSAREAWDNCERGDWMLWAAKDLGVDKRVLVGAAVECAKLVEHLMNDERSINALRVCERYANGDATDYELLCAAKDAGSADEDSDSAADAYAAYAAFSAAACSPYAAADHAADSAAFYAAAEHVRKKTLKTCADIVREKIPFESLEILHVNRQKNILIKQNSRRLAGLYAKRT